MDPVKQGTTISEAIASTDTTTPPAAAPAAAAPAATPASTPPQDDSEEARELREAEAAAAAEASGTTVPATPAAAAPAAAPASTPASAAAPAAAAPAAAPASTPAAAAPGVRPAEKMVPVSALAKERAARQKAEAAANFHAGQASALAAVANARTGTQAAPSEPEQSPEELELQDIKTQKRELAKQADKGTLSLEDWEVQRDALDDRAAELRALINAPAPAASPQRDDLTLQERTAQLETQYPVVKTLSEAATAALVDLAYDQAARDGKPIGKGPAATLQLRERVAKLAQSMYGGGQPAAAAPAAGSTTATPAHSPAAQARADKLVQAAAHPPDVSTMGAAGTGTGISEAELEARLNNASTEEEAAAIMAGAPQLVNKIMGRIQA